MAAAERDGCFLSGFLSGSGVLSSSTVGSWSSSRTRVGSGSVRASSSASSASASVTAGSSGSGTDPGLVFADGRRLAAGASGAGGVQPTVVAEKTICSSSGWGLGITSLLTTRLTFAAAASAASMAAFTAPTWPSTLTVT